MVRPARSTWGAVAIVLTAWVGVASRAADDAPVKAPKSTQGTAKSASGEEASKSPEKVLSARGLTRSGASYILEKQEDECFKKFDAIRPLYERLETSYNKLVAIAMSEAQVAELQAEQAMVQQQIQSLNASGSSRSRSSGRYGGRYARYAQNPNALLQQQLRTQQSALAQQLALAKQAVHAKLKQETTALYERDRNQLLESSTEVRELFEKVQKEYTDIGAEPPVHAALEALRKSAKALLKIAPSAEFIKKLARLKKLERMMRPESATLASSAKGRSKSKHAAKSKR